MEEEEKIVLRKKLSEFVETNFGTIRDKREDEVSRIFWDMYIALTRVLSRDLWQELKEPQIIKLEFIDKDNPPSNATPI